MKNNELLTVAEFAEMVEVSRQAVYKRMETDLSTHVVLVDNKKMLKRSAITAFLKTNLSTCKPSAVESDSELTALKKLVETLEKENELKQQTIDRLVAEKAEEHRQLMTLTGQVGTALQSLTQGQLAEKLIEGAKLQSGADALPAEEPQEEIEAEQQTKRWWHFWK